MISPGTGAVEARWFATPLGEHLLVRTATGWRHLDARTGRDWPEPPTAALRPLIAAALAADPARYGELLDRRPDGHWRTSTGVEVRLDWTRLALSQSGRDTRAIELAYRIHYLQWTGTPAIDRGLGAAGLAGVAALALLGLRLARTARRSDPPR